MSCNLLLFACDDPAAMFCTCSYCNVHELPPKQRRLGSDIVQEPLTYSLILYFSCFKIVFVYLFCFCVFV